MVCPGPGNLQAGAKVARVAGRGVRPFNRWRGRPPGRLAQFWVGWTSGRMRMPGRNSATHLRWGR